LHVPLVIHGLPEGAARSTPGELADLAICSNGRSCRSRRTWLAVRSPRTAPPSVPALIAEHDDYVGELANDQVFGGMRAIIRHPSKLIC
jgi:hypothetical protein